MDDNHLLILGKTIDKSPTILILMINPSNNICQYITKSCKLMTQYLPEEIIGKNGSDILCTSSFIDETINPLNLKIIQGVEIPNNYFTTIKRKDTTIFPAEVIILIQSPTMLVIQIRDISTEVSLKKKYELYETLLNQCKEVCWIIDVDQNTKQPKYIYASPSCDKVHEVSSNDLIENINNKLDNLTPKSRKKMNDALQHTVQTGKGGQIMGNYLLPKTKKIRQHRSGWCVQKINGTLRCYGTTSDVSIEYETISLQTAKEYAEMENRKKRSFLERTCHEQRNLHMGVSTGTELTLHNINNITGSIKDLLKAINETKKIVEVIAESSEQVNYLLDTTLNLQQIDNESFEYSYDFHNIQNTVNMCTKKFSHTLKISDINMSISVDPFLCRILLRYDQLKITQCLVNYISNAYKFTDKGSIKIRIKYEMDSELVQLLVEVEDTGIGIKDGIQLFELYKQLNPIQEGSGIGLFLVKRFIKEGHNGSVGFQSTLGKGSIFMFSFKTQYMMPKIKNLTGSLSCRDLQEKNKDILLVEDMSNNRLLISIMLMKLGYQYEEVKDGQEAIDKLNNTDFKLILTDRKMPNVDGLELTKIIKKNNKDQLIIGITGNSIPDQINEWIIAGVSEVIIKPCKLEQLKKILERYLHPICSIGSGV